jgi:hypothetical protein
MAIFALVSGNAIIELSPVAFPVHPNFVWTTDISAISPQPQVGWTAVKTDGAWAFTAPPAPPAPTLAQQAMRLQALGLAITSAGTASLDATYPTDANTIGFINSEVSAIGMNGTFADGTSSIEWPDVNGVIHEFNIAQFKQFATVIGVFVSRLRKCIIGAAGVALPVTSAEID